MSRLPIERRNDLAYARGVIVNNKQNASCPWRPMTRQEYLMGKARARAHGMDRGEIMLAYVLLACAVAVGIAIGAGVCWVIG